MGAIKVLAIHPRSKHRPCGASKAMMELSKEMNKHNDINITAVWGTCDINHNKGVDQAKWLLNMTRQMKKLTKSHDIIHFWCAFPGVYLPKYGRPYIITCHGTDVPGRSVYVDKKVYRWAIGYRKLWENAKSVTTINKKMAALAHNFCKREVKIMPNGVHHSRKPIYTRRYHRIKLVTACQLAPIRKVHLLVDAMKDMSLYELDIYGAGPLYKDLQSQIESLSLQNRVQLRGWVNNLEPKLGAYDLYVQTGTATGHTMSALEAMSYGVPCVKNCEGSYRICIEHATDNLAQEREQAYEYIQSLPSWSDVAGYYRELYAQVYRTSYNEKDI